MTDNNQLQQYTYEADGYEIILTPEIVRKVIANGNPDVTTGEVLMFIEFCKSMKYNPFAGDVYLIKYQKDKPAQYVVSKEYQMKKAFANKDYDGHQAGIIIQRGNEVIEVEGAFKLATDLLLGGWAKVYIKDKKIPVVMKVALSEYNQGKSLWGGKPSSMIRKVALGQALKEAFPKEAGSYTDDIDHQPHVQKQAEEIPEAKTYEPLPFEPADEADYEVVDDAELLDDDMEKAFDEVAEKADVEMESFLHAEEVEEIEW